MKKLLLTLCAVLIGLSSAHAVDYYLIGGFNSWTLKQTNCKFTEQGDGTYVLDYKGTLTSGFKINDGTWGATYNYGAQNSAKLTVGQPYTVWANSNSGNIETSDGGSINNPHIVFTPSQNTLLITGEQKQAVTIYGIHGDIFGDSSWSTENMTEDNGNWVLNKTINAGAFGIKAMDKDTGNQTGWYSTNNASDAVIEVGKEVTCVLNGNTNFSIAAGTYTFTFNPKTLKLTVTGTSTGETPEVDPYASWWVNVMGSFAGGDNTDTAPSTQPVDGIASFTNLALGTAVIEIKTWDGSTDGYYSNGSTPIPVGQWVELGDAQGVRSAIAGATDNSVYNIQFNVKNNEVYIELVSGGSDEPTPTPTFPEKLYMMGDVNGYAWATDKGIETTGVEGVYTWTGVVVNDNNGVGYVNFGTVLGSNWDAVNAGNRYGAPGENTPLNADKEGTVTLYAVPNAGDCQSWAITPGTYDFTVDLNKMTISIKADESDQPVEPEPDYGEEIDATFNFASLTDIQSYNKEFPNVDKWTTPTGSTPNNEINGMVFTSDGINFVATTGTGTTSPKVYNYSTTNYDLRVYSNNILTISAPEGYKLTEIILTCSSSNTYISKLALVSGEAGSLTNNSNDKTMTWIPGDASVNSVKIYNPNTSTSPQRVANITVKAVKIEGGEEPTPEVPEIDWVVKGSFDEWGEGLKFTSEENGVYSTETIAKLQEFKLVNDGTWYGYDGTGNAPLNTEFSIAAGDNYGNVKFGETGYVKDAVISFNPSTRKVKVTGTWVDEAPVLYFMCEASDWKANESYKLSTTDGNIYTITLDSFAAGAGFKIAAASWSPEYTTNNMNMSNGTYDIVGGNNMGLSVTLSNVTFTLNISEKKFTVNGVAGKVEVPTTLYIIGNLNNKDWAADNTIELKPVVNEEGQVEKGKFYGNAITIDNAGSGDGYFAFCTQTGSGSGDWSGLGTRYGAESKDLPIAGTTASATQKLAITGDNFSFMIPAGEYDFVVSFDAQGNGTVQVGEAGTLGVDGIAAEDGEAVYFNLQGQKVLNPERGIYVKVQNGKAVKVVK